MVARIRRIGPAAAWPVRWSASARGDVRCSLTSNAQRSRTRNRYRLYRWHAGHQNLTRSSLAGEGQTGERYKQRLEAAGLMAEIEARRQHLPGGFHSERKRIKIHIQAVADSALVTRREELSWLAIGAVSAWLPNPVPAEAGSPQPWAFTCSSLPLSESRTSRSGRALTAARSS